MTIPVSTIAGIKEMKSRLVERKQNRIEVLER